MRVWRDHDKPLKNVGGILKKHSQVLEVEEHSTSSHFLHSSLVFSQHFPHFYFLNTEEVK